MGTYADRSNHYIDMSVAAAFHDERALTELMDDKNDGNIEAPFNKCREMAEKEFEGYVKPRAEYPIPVIDSDGDVPIQAETWISYLFIYHAYGRRPDAATQQIIDDYDRTKQELLTFSKTGIPVLITFPEIAPGAFNIIAGNMSEEDLAKEPACTESIVSYWKDML